jgi:hypothetical protein
MQVPEQVMTDECACKPDHKLARMNLWISLGEMFPCKNLSTGSVLLLASLGRHRKSPNKPPCRLLRNGLWVQQQFREPIGLPISKQMEPKQRITPVLIQLYLAQIISAYTESISTSSLHFFSTFQLQFFLPTLAARFFPSMFVSGRLSLANVKYFLSSGTFLWLILKEKVILPTV